MPVAATTVLFVPVVLVPVIVVGMVTVIMIALLVLIIAMRMFVVITAATAVIFFSLSRFVMAIVMAVVVIFSRLGAHRCWKNIPVTGQSARSEQCRKSPCPFRADMGKSAFYGTRMGGRVAECGGLENH